MTTQWTEIQSIQEARRVTKRLLLSSIYNRLLYTNLNVAHVMELAQMLAVRKLSHVAVFGKGDSLVMPTETQGHPGHSPAAPWVHGLSRTVILNVMGTATIHV
jgi:hypothetical protein